VIELAGGDRNAGAETVVNDLIKEALYAGIVVALQIAPTRSCALPRPSGCRAEAELSSSRADSIAPLETTTAFAVADSRCIAPVPLDQIGHSDDVAAFVRIDAFRHSVRHEFALPGGEGTGNQGVLRAVLAVGGAGEAHAVAALARRPDAQDRGRC